ncbi:uncharacterized protein LOC123535673 isoform X2 [Mercenaria mercenaria]|uniref:uncharacterized protein LOC123535673 isoform X2 n=1 Tax=Mercenaria mercenaria TaxID=6596 RepID=UPI00234E4392|nr:uncharacterized protein LOC123535673 isoform X2 [Mercenaria mercenaria]
MDEEEPAEGLNDLRKKRLAYFETLNQTEKECEQLFDSDRRKFDVSRRKNGDLLEAVLSDKQHKADDISYYKNRADKTEHGTENVSDKVGSSIINDSEMRFEKEETSFIAGHINTELQDLSLNGFREKQTVDTVQVVKTKSDSKAVKDKEHKTDLHHLKTSSFYFSNPEHEQAEVKHETDKNSDGLDAYNETVERLIRATKEEILGIKVSDDIWTNFRKKKGDTTKDIVHDKTNEMSDRTKMQSDVTAQIDWNNASTKKTPRDFRRSFSETGCNENAQKDHNDNMMKGYEHNRKSNIMHREHRSSFSNSYDSRPIFSHSEPAQKFHHDPGENQTRKSSNSSKIEEIFSSRQIMHSQIPNSAFTQESREFETIKQVTSNSVNQSCDFSDLGLSTHRPESERTDKAKVEADDINLGDTVTKELRTLLGEEKFNQFLMKAKRDIDDLHQDRSNENSARKDKTPRLVKDKPVKPSKHAVSSELKADQPKSILKNKDSVVQKTDIGTKDQARKQRSLSESKEVHSSTFIHDSNDFTPRRTDAEAVENLIGEFVLAKDISDTSKRLTSNPAYKKKTAEEKTTEVEENVKNTVPALNLEDINKSESPRPKLNRPKHEPPTIYQERSEKDVEQHEKKLDRDVKPNTSKNYEQVTVPRNVAFSANEIYNQAYGAFYPGQAPLVSPNFHGGSVIHPQYSSPPGTAYNGPLTPSTPVIPSHVIQTVHPDQFPSQGGHTNYSEEFNSFKNFSHQAYGSDRPQIPHPPGQQGLPMNVPHNSVYASTPDFRSFAPTNVQRFAAPVLSSEQPFHVPHPPQTSMPLSQSFNQTNVPVPSSNSQGIPFNYPYQYPVGIDQNMAAIVSGPKVFPPYLPVGIGSQVFTPHPPTSLGAQIYQPGYVAPPSTSKAKDVRQDMSQQPPPTPTTSNVEVQTDREEITANEKETVVEESTFTSVSQIVDEEKFIPHPPAKRKEGGPSPRRPHHAKDLAAKNTQNSKRHIDGIRQHHEQRRQQYEDEKLSEDQIIERQKKFAKASLDRYFSSLENIYSSSSKLGTSGINSDTNLSVVEDEEHVEVSNERENELGEQTVIDDVMSNVPVNAEIKIHENEIHEENVKTGDEFRPVVHGFVDFSEKEEVKTTENISNIKQFEMDNHVDVFEKGRKEFDSDTLVSSMANTDATLNAGGVTERLNELGIDVSHVKHSEMDKKLIREDKKKAGKKDKILIVCPECQGLNKEYMSWCTKCGEMIIGVEPVLVSKNREGKIRTKPLNKDEIIVSEEIRIKNPELKEIDTKLVTHAHEVNYVQELDEKPFTLNLEGIKSDKEEHLEVFENKKVSPIKSDGRDSGRPSSDDPDLELQTQKIEEEVVNDICASISDPVLKGYVKSHFSKSKSWQDNEGKVGKTELDDDIDSLVNTTDTKNLKNIENGTHHDVVNIVFDTKDIYNKDDLAEVDTRHTKSELIGRHGSEEDYNPAKYETHNAHDNVKAKIAMFNQNMFEDDIEKSHLHKFKNHGSFSHHEYEERVLSEPPPLPNFSATLPVSHNELSLKLPANSLDYSTDVSQVVSNNFENIHKVTEKGDNVVEEEEETAEEKERKKAERRQERRNKRGHGAIDVEVFGYEESRESRNSSRANRMVPLLNLAGNSSDEDDSVHSDFKPVKPDFKQEVKQKSGSMIQLKASVSAWGPAVIQEEPHEAEESVSWQQPFREENINLDKSSFPWKQTPASLTYELQNPVEQVNLQANTANNVSIKEDSARSPEIASPDIVQEVHVPKLDVHRTEPAHVNMEDSDEWKHLFDPNIEIQQEEQEPGEVAEDEAVEGNQPFLMQLINQPKPQKSKKKPKSARGKPVKSKVRQSIEEPGYQRKWNRSSTAWSSYNQGELNTSSSLRSSSELTKSRPSSAPKSRFYGSKDTRASFNHDLQTSAEQDSSARGFLGQNRRPVSAPKSRANSSSVQASINIDEEASLNQDVRGISPTRSLPKKNTRPVSAPKSRMHSSDLQASVSTDGLDIMGRQSVQAAVPKTRIESIDMQDSVINNDNKASEDPDDHSPQLEDHVEQTSSPPGAASGKKTRPFSADLQKRKTQKKKNKKGGDIDFDLELDLISEMVEHRLPKPSAIDRLTEHMASPRSTYDKYIEMTPRIQAGTVSRWQCLPDEILIHVFSYLDQSSLTKCAQVCQQYYRVAMDETLWKYITIKKNDIEDSCLEEIARRHPVSLALIQCQGERVTARALRDLFRECAQSLRELNISRCSRGALNGDSLLLHAAARCHNLTHVDASWCSLTDSGLMAISNSCYRLESLCINGCSAISNDGLETVMKKHGCHLRVLEMFGCFNLSPRGLRSVANNCINLLTLSLGQCYKLTDSCISQLSTSLGRVESLDLRGCKQIKDNCMRRVVKNCGRLKHLSLANCPNITDVSILEISTYLTDIRSIDLCGCKNITDGSIRALVNTCTNLRHIDISSTNCTHRSVSMIANFSGQRLETLKINFLSDVTEQSLIKLARHCRRLQSVHMYGCTSVRNIDKVKEERPSFTIEM